MFDWLSLWFLKPPESHQQEHAEPAQPCTIPAHACPDPQITAVTRFSAETLIAAFDGHRVSEREFRSAVPMRL